MGGSPPLTREQRVVYPAQGLTGGITPAYAGTTAAPGSYLFSDQDHPRLRGNNLMLELIICDIEGSPPLTREQQVRRTGLPRFPGITPAYAGTTDLPKMPSISLKDHPRLRGNNYHTAFLMPHKTGSPPLTREQQKLRYYYIYRARITPAYAGTTRSC